MESHSDFGFALFLLKEGHRVARAGWNGKGMWLALVRPCSENDPPRYKPGYIAVGEEIEGLTRLPWIGMRTADNGFVPWLASQTDMLAEDWVDLEVIEAPEINRDPLPGWENHPPDAGYYPWKEVKATIIVTPEQAAKDEAAATDAAIDGVVHRAVERLLVIAEERGSPSPDNLIEVLMAGVTTRLKRASLAVPADLRARCNNALTQHLMRD